MSTLNIFKIGQEKVVTYWDGLCFGSCWGALALGGSLGWGGEGEGEGWAHSQVDPKILPVNQNFHNTSTQLIVLYFTTRTKALTFKSLRSNWEIDTQ